MTQNAESGSGLDFSMKAGGPGAIRVKCCQSCNRTDLFSPVRAKHYSPNGGWCPGPVIDVIYARIAQDAPPESGQPKV